MHIKGEDRFEQELTRAMRRVDAPVSLAEHVMLAAAGERSQQRTDAAKGKVIAFPRVKMWVGSAIAASLVAGVFGAEQMHRRNERMKAEQAQQEFDAAVRVTDRALAQTRAHLERAGLKLSE